MLKLCHQCRGALSVLLVLIMLPMFIFAGLCVDGTRVTAAKSNVSGAAISPSMQRYQSMMMICMTFMESLRYQSLWMIYRRM